MLVDPRVRRAARVAVPLLGWAALVVVAVVQGRELRDDTDATGSWVVLVACSLGAVVALYVALVGMLRGRLEADRTTTPGGRHTGPRHRA